ncbi:MAG: UDP-N-acetylmuramoyl-tripeptide--D-alanyl-D-alanine ligase [Clostridia bacterium]|nr:UDP-N-acetylmuramoyl-tripeptide--D-alanyl-D-alanine ligase [Clostridia bacterium]
MNYTLRDVATLTGGTLHKDSNGERLFTTVNSDSRLIKNSDTLFAALKGDNFDGHSFASELCKNGGAIIDDPDYFCPNSVLVPSVKKALYVLAEDWRNNHIKNLKVLAITGSVGKTSAKNMAYLAMSSCFKCYKTAGNRNSLTGLPMELLNIGKDVEYAVLEAGMSLPGEISQISRLIKPSGALITKIGHSHIMAFGSREGICKEKLSILDGMENGFITVPDDGLVLSLLPKNAVFTVCSVDNASSDAYTENAKETPLGMEYTLCYEGKKYLVRLPAFGMHSVMNSALVLVSAIRMGADGEKAAKALANFVAEGNRQNIHYTNGIKVIADCYNAAPESMAAALNVLKTCGGKRIAVLGDMLELGEHSEALHESVGKAVEGCADMLICVGEEAKYIALAAEKIMNKEDIYVYPSADYEKAAKLVAETAKEGDTVLFKASNRTNLRKVMEITAL